LQEYDWEKIQEVIDGFKAGKTVTMPCVDLVTQRVDQLTTSFAETEVLVIDGLYAIHTPQVDLAVYIELTYHETKKAQTGRGKEEANAFRFEVLEAEHQAVLSIRHKAQWFVSKEYQLVAAAV
jgi:uridine kinase